MKRLSLKHRENISKGLKNKPKSEDCKRNMSIAWKNKKVEPLQERAIRKIKENKKFNEAIKNLPKSEKALIQAIKTIKKDFGLSNLESDILLNKIVNYKKKRS